jgi:hypothetical protein
MGRGREGHEWGIEERPEQCVVCGIGSSVQDDVYLTLHHIIPHSYRTYFPEKYKSHANHDVLPMCHACHMIHQDKVILKIEKALAGKFNAPLEGKGWDVSQQRAKVKKAAAALLNQKQAANIPSQRFEELKYIVLSYYNHQIDLTEALRKANELQFREKTPDFKSHGQLVIQGIMEEEKSTYENVFEVDPLVLAEERQCGIEYVNIARFVRECRQVFLETMRPEYLSPHWRVKNAVN